MEFPCHFFSSPFPTSSIFPYIVSLSRTTLHTTDGEMDVTIWASVPLLPASHLRHPLECSREGQVSFQGTRKVFKKSVPWARYTGHVPREPREKASGLSGVKGEEGHQRTATLPYQYLTFNTA